MNIFDPSPGAAPSAMEGAASIAGCQAGSGPDRTGREGPAGMTDRPMLAHDIRGALQSVMGGVAQIERAKLDPTIRMQVERVSAAAATLYLLVESLLSEPGQQPEPSRDPPVDLRQFTEDTLRRWSGEARAKGLSFRVQTDPDLPLLLEVARVPLVRMIGNLVGNAIKHTGSGEVVLSMGRAASGGATFCILDDGPGVHGAALEKVFGEGYHAPQDKGPIHGLGLHIVNEVAQSLGAVFEIGNRDSGGAEARLSFPPALSRTAAAVAEDPRPAVVDLKGLRILLAEDNPTNQMVAMQMLRALNAQVSVSSDGIEALETFERADFDLVIVDIEMPRMSGLDVIRTIRKRKDARSRTPIVALTAYALREHRDRIAEAGANGLISKPITSINALGRMLSPHIRADAPQSEAEAAPPVACGSPSVPVVDSEIYEALRQTLGSDMDELLDKVISDLETARVDLSEAIDPVAAPPIRSASHILISVAGAVGAQRLESCARAINTAIGCRETEGIADDVRRCISEIDAAVDFARRERAGGRS